MTTLYCARWVLPVASAPIEDGAVAVDGALIVGVGKRGALSEKFPKAAQQSFGEAAIMPGLVNAHSHLELTAMRGFLEREEGDFFAWLRKITVARLERMTPDDLYVSAAWGAVEAARAGVTCFGDASDAANASLRALCDVGLRGTVYQESFGPDPTEAREQFEKLRDKALRLREDESARVRLGISPHAPYSVSAPLLELLTEFVLANKLPMMMHAAEPMDETLLMLEGRGVFAESMARRGIEWRAPEISSVQYLNALGVLRAEPLLAHCIRVDDADLDVIKTANARIAHCPKSNAKLGHGRASLANFINKKIVFGLGSDSVASNNTCDLLEEARFALLLARASNDVIDDERMVNAQDVLFAATCGGARALGLDDKIGILAAGMEADLAIVALGGAHQIPVRDPLETLVFSSSGRDVLLTMVAGSEVYRQGRVLNVDEERLRARMKEIDEAIMG
jgi:cytosine/adenosine deaminase-related metal-dependent hydrolase